MESVTRAVEAITYVPESDRALPGEQQTKITLRPMTQAERMKAIDDEDAISYADGATRMQGRHWQRNFALARDHIVAVERFPVDAPKLWPVSGTRAEKEAYLALMPEAAVFLIGQEVFEKSIVSALAKN